ncbi:MAG: DNA primase [Candidatus Krumholzibacteria bacterium]|nr:DNA primase [Candidatus Krumholzibacteria bacterium]
MIPDKIINDIRERTDIVETVGSVLDLKRSGRNFKAACPFHNEKTPSFMVSPDKQIYHCFGCGKGGNVFNFIMEYEGVSFVEAVRKLAGELGLDISQYLGGGEDRQKLDPYYRATEFARDYYREILLSSSVASKAREYLDRREVDEETSAFFSLGYVGSGWDGLYMAASEAGIDRDILLELRLVIKSRGGSGFRDYFRNRLIFPISTVSNRTVGFAGRVLDDSEPKYLNSAENPIYSKSRILYGLNHSKDEIRKAKSAIIVEGYADYLMLWKNGVRNIAAVCGTSLTGDQSRLLARYAKRIYIINDGDRAGIRAAVRAADQLLVEGLDIQIVILPEEEDPDSFVRKKGAEALWGLMRSAPDYFNYLKQEAEKGSRTAYRKSQVVGHLLNSVSRVRDAVTRAILLQEVSNLFEIPVDTLRTGLKPERPGADRKADVSKAVESKRAQIQKDLFRLGLEDSEYARAILDNLMEEDFEGDQFRQYYKALDLALKNDIDITSPEFIGSIKDPDLSRLASEIALMEVLPGPVREMLDDTLVWLKKAALRDEMREMMKRIVELQAQGGEERSIEELEIAEAYRKIAREYRRLGLKEDSGSDESQ